MELIAEAGGTGIDWVLFDQKKIFQKTKTKGFNATSHTRERLDIVLQEVKSNLGIQPIGKLWFYVAGLSDENRAGIEKHIRQYFPHSLIYLEGDLLAAARAVCGSEKGLVSILGTGSITCWYDGRKILRKSPSIGYILGDEGGGVNLGRSLLQAYFRQQLPEMLSKSLVEVFDPHEVRKKLYLEGGANQYMASFVPFIHEHQANPFIHKLLVNCLEDWVKYQVLLIKEKDTRDINLVGSIAFFFQEFIFEVLQKYELRARKIIKNPMEALVIYHQKQTIV